MERADVHDDEVRLDVVGDLRHGPDHESSDDDQDDGEG
jgi:hypothetical protein